MSLQAILTSLLLPPLLLVLLALAGGLLALRRRGLGALLVLLSSGLILFLATPFAAGHLLASLETGFDRPTDPNNPPRAVIILSGDAAHDISGLQPGPLTLERMAAGVRLARAKNLPVLVTGGRFSPAAKAGVARKGATKRSKVGRIMAVLSLECASGHRTPNCPVANAPGIQ